MGLRNSALCVEPADSALILVAVMIVSGMPISMGVPDFTIKVRSPSPPKKTPRRPNVNWYSQGKKCVALRKHQMRVDLRVYCGEATDFTNPNDLSSSIKSVITSAIMKGLDIVGVVSNIGPQIGWQALKLSKDNKMDVFVVPGEDYQCADKAHLLVYLLKESMPIGLTMEQAVSHARSAGGFVILSKITKRQAQWLDRVKGSQSAPQGVELYADDYQGYTDSHLAASYQCFVNSGARSAGDLDQSTAFTIINREDIESLGLLPEDEGEDYEPGYLQRDEQIQQGANPGDVASGTVAPVQPQPTATTAIPSAPTR